MYRRTVIVVTIAVVLLVFVPSVYAFVCSQVTQQVGQVIVNKPYYYVNQLSNVDSSADKGTHSNFTAQEYGPDTINDLLTEANSALVAVNLNSYIDNNSGNVDSSIDKGTESNFADMQTAPDSTYNTLTEGDQDAGTSTLGKTSGTGTSYSTIGANQMYGQVFTAGSTGEIYQATFYGRSSYVTAYAKFVITDSSGNILPNGVSDSVTVSTTAGSKTATWNAGARPTVVSGTTYWIMVVASANSVRLYYQAATGGTSRIDTSNSYSTPTSPTDASSGAINYRLLYCNIYNLDYELDHEYQWTTANYTQSNEELCVKTGTLSNEALLLQVWNGSWQTLSSGLSSSAWNNFTITSYLSSETCTIRFVDGMQSNDATKSTWQIDSVLLHTWTAGGDYELDLEVQWINVDFSEANEQLCIYGGTMGSESLRVDVWTGSSWQNVFANLASGWNNVTVSEYLTESTFTVRFKGNTEIADAVQDSWQIDTAILHNYS